MGRKGDLLVSDTPITVPEFIKVRQHVANLLKENSSTQISTRIRQAENLLTAGVIDVQAVLDHLTPKATADDAEDRGYEPAEGDPTSDGNG